MITINYHEHRLLATWSVDASLKHCTDGIVQRLPVPLHTNYHVVCRVWSNNAKDDNRHVHLAFPNNNWRSASEFPTSEDHRMQHNCH